jgi:hypothetical protein
VNPHLANRRAYLFFADAIRALPVAPRVRTSLATAARIQLTGYPSFEPNRFRVHAATPAVAVIPTALADQRAFLALAESIADLPVPATVKKHLTIVACHHLRGHDAFEAHGFRAQALAVQDQR